MSRPLHIITRSALPATACAALALLSAGAVKAAEPGTAPDTEAVIQDEGSLLQGLLFPEGSGVSITGFKKTSPANEPAVTEWEITGYAKEEAIALIATLNTRSGITGVFRKVAETPHRKDFLKPTDSLVVNVRTLENPGYKATASKEALMDPKGAFQLKEKEPAKAPATAGDSGYPFTFQMVITRRPADSRPLSK